jgi:hypothetical protein
LIQVVVELREWSRMAEELKEARNRLTNRIRQQLWRYFPQALDLGEDPGAEWFLDLWALAPTPAAVGKLTEKKVARILIAHRIGSATRRFGALWSSPRGSRRPMKPSRREIIAPCGPNRGRPGHQA